MNPYSRNKLYLLIGLSVLLIGQAVLFLVLNPGLSTGIKLIFFVIALLALAVVAVGVVAVRREGRKLAGLPDDFRAAYVAVGEETAVSSMSFRQKRETMDMILDLFVTAASNNRSLESVTGGDLGAFTRGFIRASAGRITPVHLLLTSSGYFIAFLLMMKLYKLIRAGDYSALGFRNSALDLGIIITYALISFIFLPWLMLSMKQAASGAWSGVRRVLILLPLMIPMGLMAALIFIEAPGLRSFIDRPVLLFSSWPLLTLGVIASVLCFFSANYVRRLRLRDEYRE